jgi:FADH2 O2-dependent halogenase
MNPDFDLAVVGSGFGGSLLAMLAQRLGWRVCLLERGRHPRFAIGESSTPLANLLLEELGARYELPAVASLAKWGTWQKSHPQVACGLKRGFTFFHHAFGRPWSADPAHARQLLVAASPQDFIADTHWYRPHFDQFLVEQACALGVEFLDNVALQSVFWPSGEDVAELAGRRGTSDLLLRTRLVIDASGPRGFLHRALRLSEQTLGAMPQTRGLYAHFAGVERWDMLYPADGSPPYPVDDAAMHHVFEGGWIWVLRFNNGLTSAGVAAAEPLGAALHFEEGEPGWKRLLERLPAVRAQFAEAIPVTPWVHAAPLSFRSELAAGAGWALLPSAAGFVDPLLSTGFPLTLLGVERLGRLFADYGPRPHAARTHALERYAQESLDELDMTAELVASLYASFGDFELFRRLTLLYFASAMFAETVRRLGHPEKAPGFLLHRHTAFGPALRDCLRRARTVQNGQNASEREHLFDSIRECIEPFNLASLGEPARRHWYPAVAEDLLASAAKLGVDHVVVTRLLQRCGFTPLECRA